VSESERGHESERGQAWNMHFGPTFRGRVDSRRLFFPLGPQRCIMATMARPPRIDFPDALYHVTSRGNGRDVIFWSDADRERFLGQLADNLRTAAKSAYSKSDPAPCSQKSDPAPTDPAPTTATAATAAGDRGVVADLRR